jgi:hypothetical protein
MIIRRGLCLVRRIVYMFVRMFSGEDAVMMRNGMRMNRKPNLMPK